VKIGILDYGAGNTVSVERALKRLGAESYRVTVASDLEGPSGLVLPGVGHFETLIRALDRREIRDSLLSAIQRGVPFLGICLGLQALYKASDEAPNLRGLEIFDSKVCALPAVVKLPHMGWNRVKVHKPSTLLRGVSSEAYFYFAHTYAAPSGGNESVASCSYGKEFVAVLERDNLHAVQFHPEKSGDAGARVLQNFLGLCA
jgi:imidazole glycerol phosphate synthase glutamine amidotransferase subunit